MCENTLCWFLFPRYLILTVHNFFLKAFFLTSFAVISVRLMQLTQISCSHASLMQIFAFASTKLVLHNPVSALTRHEAAHSFSLRSKHSRTSTSSAHVADSICEVHQRTMLTENFKCTYFVKVETWPDFEGISCLLYLSWTVIIFGLKV